MIYVPDVVVDDDDNGTEKSGRLPQDLDNETLLHIDAENRRQTLEEELEFLKQVHEQVTPVFVHVLTSCHIVPLFVIIIIIIVIITTTISY